MKPASQPSPQISHSTASLQWGCIVQLVVDFEMGGFHVLSYMVIPRCGCTKEWCRAFGLCWFLMNHRCCFDFKRSQVWAVFVLKKSQRLEGAGAEAVCFWGISIRWGWLHQEVVFPWTRLLVIYAKRPWSDKDTDRAMVLNCCLFFF